MRTLRVLGLRSVENVKEYQRSEAREDMNRMREETRKRIGTVEVAVDLIRDAREQ